MLVSVSVSKHQLANVAFTYKNPPAGCSRIKWMSMFINRLHYPWFSRQKEHDWLMGWFPCPFPSNSQQWRQALCRPCGYNENCSFTSSAPVCSRKSEMVIHHQVVCIMVSLRGGEEKSITEADWTNEPGCRKQQGPNLFLHELKHWIMETKPFGRAVW